MKDERTILDQRWVEMVEPLYESNPEGWAEINALALGVACGEYEFCGYKLPPELQYYWNHTKIIPKRENMVGRISYCE